MPDFDVKTGKSGYPGDVFAALSASNLAMLGIWDQLIYAEGGNLYYLPTYTWHGYLAAMILLLLLSAVFLTALRKLRTSGNIRLQLLSAAVLAAYAPLIANATRLIFDWPIDWIIKELSDPFNAAAGLAASVAALVLVWRLRRPVAVVLYAALLVFSPFAPLNAVYAGYEGVSLAVAKSPPPPNKPVNRSADNPHPQAKTLLMIFDELDYRMTFEERIPGLELKNFNYLKQNSFFFTNVTSLFPTTYAAIPALTIGRPVKPFYTGPDDLGIEFKVTGDKSTWRTTETLFSRLDEAGKNIALIGYYHPYCRIFGDMVDFCKSYATTRAMAPSGSVYQSLIKQAVSLTPFYRVLDSIETYKGQERDIIEAVTHAATDFIYVHLKLPHSPYIYDRASEKLTIFNVVDGYIDNLKLADILLGKVIVKLKEENLWDTFTLVVSSDHHWRKPWEYDGVVSRKIPLLVKLPGQNTMHISDAELSLLHLKPMLEKIVFDRIRNPAELAAEFEETGDL